MSTYSHLLGVVLSVVALIILVVESADSPARMVAFSIYGTSLILLYSASTMYHWLHVSPQAEDLLKRFDHAAIFILIAGSYTPVCLLTLPGEWGWSLFSIVWAAALAGVVLKLFFEHISPWPTTALYLGMGWFAIVAVVPLVRSVDIEGLLWLLAGGVLYTVGAIIHTVRRPNPIPDVFEAHEVFHVLVLAGSGVHFSFMMRYVVPVV